MVRRSLLALSLVVASPARGADAARAAPVAPAPAPAERVPAIAPALAPSVARPGDAVLVRVPLAPGAEPPTATLAGRPLSFWRAGDEAWALAALPLETPPGRVSLDVGSPLGAAGAAALDVVEPGFPSRTLEVPPRFVEPPRSVRKRIEADRRAFAAAWARPFSPPLFGAPFRWPRPERVNGRFGDQRVFNGKKESVHYGVDVSAPRGAPVHAANDGVVVLARNAYLSGKSVVLWHGADVFTVYFHLDRISVRRGARVKQGDTLGLVGSTGRSTGPHLHWSAKVAGLYVDPESLLGIDFRSGSAPPRRAGSPPPPSEPHAEPASAPAEAAPATPRAAATSDAGPTR
ncbi:MAG TPA: M23 family metallopeptidase [Anaeromyxobacter sp.]|nr:M23 family metallopeptidase [Anaeromyxobacter sp.]